MSPIVAREPVLCLDKPAGWSPVETLRVARRTLPGYGDAVLGYAGRLDPLAEGVLLALVDGENRRAQEYLGLEKRYRVEVLFGIATDSFDALGLIASHAPDAPIAEATVRAECARWVRTFEQRYPPFSSVRVRGRPMFHWARRGGLPAGEAPVRTRTIHSCDLVDYGAIDTATLLRRVERDVGRVQGDFRQTAVLASWHAAVASPAGYTVATLDVRCSSGTYMRSLAHEIGRALGTGAIALGIARTEVGPFTRANAIALPERCDPCA